MIDPARAGTPGGSYPRAVIWTSPTRAFVASERDREIIALDVTDHGLTVAGRTAVGGQPVAFAARGTRLYAALDNADRVAVLDARDGRPLGAFHAALGPGAPPALARLGGAGVNGLAIAGDGRTLYATNGGANAVAVIRLAPQPSASHVVGLIPTGWYPTAVAVRPDGRRLFVVNGKSNAGPVPEACRVNLGVDPHHDDACRAANQYVWQLEKAGFLTLAPPAPAALASLTRQVEANNRYAARSHAGEGAQTMAFLRAHIRHVIYIVKENRTYDQVLGDLEVGDGDPKLAIFGRAMTPNQHALARQFVDLDAFYDSGESSNTGWDWTTAARTNDWTEREAPVNYADRGLQYDQEGANRNVNVGYATSDERRQANPLSPADPNVLPGTRDVAAPDGPDDEEGRGYIWDAALRAGVSVRNYGFFGDLTRYEAATGAYQIPLEREPWKTGHIVFYVDKAALMPVTDPYFCGFNQALADYWRFKEWEREFDGFVAKGEAPTLMLVRLPHDHTGAFAARARRGGLGGDRACRQRLRRGPADPEGGGKPPRQGHADLHHRGRRPGRPRPRRRAPLDRLRGRAVREARRGGLGALHHGQHDADHRGCARAAADGPERRAGRADGGRVRYRQARTGASPPRSRRCCAPPSCRCRRRAPRRPPARPPRRARRPTGPRRWPARTSARRIGSTRRASTGRSGAA